MHLDGILSVQDLPTRASANEDQALPKEYILLHAAVGFRSHWLALTLVHDCLITQILSFEPILRGYRPGATHSTRFPLELGAHRRNAQGTSG